MTIENIHHAIARLGAKQKFPLGDVAVTPNALAAIPPGKIRKALARHACGDWGDLCEEDQQQNELCLSAGCRLFSAYQTADSTKFWIITEADRSVTTVLLPLDY